MGSKSRQGTIGAFAMFLGRPFAFLGGFVGFVSTAIAFYYSVVVGWNTVSYTHLTLPTKRIV